MDSPRSERTQTIMAIKEDVQKRAPRGTKNVTQAFFAALDDIADGQQAVVSAAALAAIRDELKGRHVKIKEAAAAAKAKAKTKMPAKRKTPARAKAAVKVAAKAPAARGARKAAPAKRAPAAVGKRAIARKTPAKKVVARKARQPKQADQAVSPSAETAAE